MVSQNSQMPAQAVQILLQGTVLLLLLLQQILLMLS
jgi:hypothetical protein